MVGEDELGQAEAQGSDGPIWKAQVMFASPGPNRTNMAAAVVAIHGRTAARRMTMRSRTAAVRWAVTISAWYGM